ncbi:hypothetical protein P153DRAFT_52310 [Dothidotthia symphoricarpi CBS 119687]|uniref:Uncharacterized protein n=1 Tax=Dothidotthia symphoricarpi CBS 119687 TaxID=1392245 RepID=A0A6A6A9T6_9PLEO|nr:uncharacterized protein P153DRAFT_52310 [Dothidotthia symphoricarpi CBS 119687]KAF2127607.1 hypothetical protein P153DRAFT_52310 [Dothidotthia symphoricarpi CBS 119687]
MPLSAPAKPHVLLLSLELSSYFDELYQRILSKLNNVATLARARKPESALQRLADQPPHAVLVTDSKIAEYRAVRAGLLDYVRAGGILVLMGEFSSSIRPPDLDKFFREAGLSWTYADYMRTRVYRNGAEGASSHLSLPSSYSQKAVFLANVSVNDAWYLPTESSRTQSLVFSPERIQDLQQTPIALTNIGSGKLGYVGDVNGEEESDEVILAMCGLFHVA